ncbi:hypothetical protein L1987_83635 [Smallanthus sonchifolius]|uniref:Uncharacterized protein n=1 Tax=Smallanthus sonchifolius TaxID=185202 RepID=A0ACB8YGP6_9ASTR|nr:hypothetical protein L1987_83635 [Smallanthus sonchifolius]
MKSGNVIPSLVVDYGQRAIVAIRETGAVSRWPANGFDVVQLVGSNDSYSGVNVTPLQLSLGGNTKRELTEDGNTDLDSNIVNPLAQRVVPYTVFHLSPHKFRGPHILVDVINRDSHCTSGCPSMSRPWDVPSFGPEFLIQFALRSILALAVGYAGG